MNNQRYTFQHNSPAGGSAGRCVGLLAIASCLFLIGLKPAFAQTEVCGSTCGAWAALTSAGPAAAYNFGAAMGLAWKGLSDNKIYYTTGLSPLSPNWTNQQQIGVAGSWYAKSNVAPALAGDMAAWKGQSSGTIFYATFNPVTETWSSDQYTIAGTDTNVSPALAYSDGITYLAWTLPTLNSTCNCNIAYLKYNNGTGVWSATTSYVTNAQTSLSPAITIVEGTQALYFAWTTPSGEIEYTSKPSGEIEYTSNGGDTIETVMNGSSPASTELAPALVAGPDSSAKDGTGPFLAWTTPSGQIDYADGDFSPWLVRGQVNNGGILSNQAPSLSTASVSNPPCQTILYLYLAFTNEANNAIYTNLVQSWDQIIKPCDKQ